jgi:hypothetical protein
MDEHERMNAHSLLQIARRSRPLLLLLALVTHVIVSGTIQSEWFRAAFMFAIIGGCLGIASFDRRSLTVGLVLAIPAAVLIFADALWSGMSLNLMSYPFLLLLFLHIIRLMLKRIFLARVVTLDTIGLALCTYVLLGLLWVLFYIPVELANPDAFVMTNLRPDQDPQSQMLYFSFVTLTTLGYGDVAPVTPLAQGLAVTEALTGVLFLAVLISRLVGSYGSRSD